MILYLFIGFFIAGLICMLFGISMESVVIDAIAFMFWIICFVGSLYVEIPYQLVVSDGVNETVSTGMHGFNAFDTGWAFIPLLFIELFHMFYLFMTNRKTSGP